MQLDDKIFYAKLLLIGEYTVINGGQALAMPLKKYGGKWVKDATNVTSREGLTKLLSYLERDQHVGHLFDLNRFNLDINDGLAFESDIPLGYGLGSSGALVAAFYDRYVYEAVTDLALLKTTLAAVEGAFHGASSGLDPLVCYLNKTIWINGPSAPIVVLENNIDLENLFLVDSLISRSTGPLVSFWKEKGKSNPTFLHNNEVLAEINANAVASLIANDAEEFVKHLKQVSLHQFANYREMIPENIVPYWQGESHFLKLCGAGGGGMMLGYGKFPDNSSLKHDWL